jgi:hypothetical protein
MKMLRVQVQIELRSCSCCTLRQEIAVKWCQDLVAEIYFMVQEAAENMLNPVYEMTG